MKPTAAAEVRARASREKRDRYLALLQAGHTPREARADIGWTDQGLRYNRKKFPQWAALCDTAKANKDKPKGPTHLMSHAMWSAKYLHRRHLAHQIRLADALDNTPPGGMTMFLCPPGSGKSSVIVDWVTRTIAEDPNHRIMYVSETSTLVNDFSTQIMLRLTNQTEVRRGETAYDFSDLVRDYGPFYEPGQERTQKKPWTPGRFTIAGANADAKDPTVAAYAITSRAYGSRADTLIVDDVQSRVSLGQTQKFLDILRQTYFNRGTPSKPLRIFVVGTRIGAGDIYERIMDDDLLDNLIVEPATHWDIKRNRLVPNVPETWLIDDNRLLLDLMTPDEIMERAIVVMDKQRKRVGAEAWHAQYEQNPKSQVISTFAQAVPNCLDHTRSIGELIDAA